jgi:predicted negative regulator of RcsB-dependent stress response
VRAETRRQLKTDRFSKATIQAAEQTVHWTVEHRGKLVVAGLIAVVIAAALLGAWYYLGQQDEKASVDFSKAVQTMNSPIRPAGMPPQPDYPSFASGKERATEAHKQFQAIVDKYPHTHAADFAHYFLGVTSADLGDYAAAERELKTVAGYYNADLSSLAKLALASVYRNTNRTTQALEVYKQLIAKPTSTVAKTTVEVQLAGTYEDAGMKAEAKKEYEQIQKESPQSVAAQVVAAKLQEMK